jgi:hypothetical protein
MKTIYLHMKDGREVIFRISGETATKLHESLKVEWDSTVIAGERGGVIFSEVCAYTIEDCRQ